MEPVQRNIYTDIIPSFDFANILSKFPQCLEIRKFNTFIKTKSSSNLVFAVLIVLVTSYYFFFKNRNPKQNSGPSLYQKIMNKLSDALALPSMMLNQNFNNNYNNDYPNFKSNSQYKKFFNRVMKNGGYPGGLQNDGNTCFMNSVIQCLASSEEFTKFLTSYASIEENSNECSDNTNTADNKAMKFLQNLKNSSNDNNSLKMVQFSNALLNLVNSLNSKHGNRSPTYKTKDLLNVMKDGPNKHLFLGYNQEDAQEFYQNVMKQVEKEFTTVEKLQTVEIITDEVSNNDQSKESENDQSKKYVNLQNDFITDLNDLGHLGNVYVPVSQIDPADDINEDKYLPYKLVTPVDGLQCDRIGCINCGEMGGIRYSVTSGLALNLPMEGANRHRFTLGELIDEFCKLEVIDGVECNRCSLFAVKDELLQKLANLKENETNLKGSLLLIEKIEERLQTIDQVLKKNCVPDEIYKKLHTKNMVQKSRKVKQSYLSRPPPLLCIHINRSVFDPRTYMVRKNNAKIDFPLELDLSDFVASTDDINLDARLKFRKQDEDMKKIDRGDLLKYKLKSVISHFGTHNYGHYIAFRKLRGQWWHISDETVRLSTEDEVLGCQGTFMLFYELTDSYVPEFPEEEEEENEKEKMSSSVESSDLSDAEMESDEEKTLNNEKEEEQEEEQEHIGKENQQISEEQSHQINIQANL